MRHTVGKTPMPKKNKGGRKPGPKWTPRKQAFIDAMKKGTMNQTDCVRVAYPRCKNPSAKACILLRDSLIVKEIEHFKNLKKIRDEERAKTAGQKEGEADALGFNEKRAILAEIARDLRSKDTDRIKAIWADAKLAGEIIDIRRELAGFEGRSPEELRHYGKHGHFPESCSEHGCTDLDGGGPAPGRVN